MRRTCENLEVAFLCLLLLTLGEGVTVLTLAVSAPRTFVTEFLVAESEARPRARATAGALRGRLLAVTAPSAVPDGRGGIGGIRSYYYCV